MDLVDKLLQVSVATVRMRPLHVHVLCSLQAQLCDSTVRTYALHTSLNYCKW